jgi:hypothetical protein
MLINSKDELVMDDSKIENNNDKIDDQLENYFKKK